MACARAPCARPTPSNPLSCYLPADPPACLPAGRLFRFLRVFRLLAQLLSNGVFAALLLEVWMAGWLVGSGLAGRLVLPCSLCCSAATAPLPANMPCRHGKHLTPA